MLQSTPWSVIGIIRSAGTDFSDRYYRWSADTDFSDRHKKPDRCSSIVKHYIVTQFTYQKIRHTLLILGDIKRGCVVLFLLPILSCVFEFVCQTCTLDNIITYRINKYICTGQGRYWCMLLSSAPSFFHLHWHVVVCNIKTLIIWPKSNS